MINPRLFQHYGIDTHKDLRIPAVCSRPFDTILVDRQGSCYACECTAWLPQSIGNLQLKSLADILETDMREHLQASVSDGSYRYCNEHRCPYIKDRSPDRKSSDDLKHIRLAIDNSCNLRCPSCRTGLIFHKEGSAYNLGIRLADRINEWLYHYSNPIKVHIGSDGDPFASHVYRHFMERTPVRDNIKYSLLTNGLMFKEFHANIPHVIDNTTELGVSIDGASSETYEKLRLGGKWDKITEALECISELKHKHNFQFVLHMVVQKDNWHEMESMLALGHKYFADRVYFNKIEDWGTDIDFESQTFTELDEFKKSIWRISTDPIAWNNVSTLV
jgi:sulfatase maturation enzyme AslB (radical SAM superfamily)